MLYVAGGNEKDESHDAPRPRRSLSYSKRECGPGRELYATLFSSITSRPYKLVSSFYVYPAKYVWNRRNHIHSHWSSKLEHEFAWPDSPIVGERATMNRTSIPRELFFRIIIEAEWILLAPPRRSLFYSIFFSSTLTQYPNRKLSWLGQTFTVDSCSSDHPAKCP